MYNQCVSQAPPVQTAVPLSFTHHISLGAGITDPGMRGLQTAPIKSRDLSCPLEEDCSQWAVGHREKGRGHTVCDWCVHPAAWRCAGVREQGRGGVPGSSEYPSCLPLLSAAKAASPRPFLALLWDSQPLFFPPQGSRWEAFPTADFQGLFLGGETPTGLWAGWAAPSGARVGRAREWSAGGGRSVECSPLPQHSEASLRGIIEYISPSAHSALPL